MIGSAHFDRVLELGCGGAEIAQAKLGQFAHYTGIDLSAVQMGRIPADLRRDPRVTILEWDLNRALQFADQSFDLAISVSTLEYLADPEAFLAEVRRVLTKGGLLILHTMNVAFLKRRLELFFGRLPSFNRAPGYEGGVLHHFTVPSLRRLLTQSGFECLELGCSGLIPDFRLIAPNILAGDMIFRCRAGATKP
jgi:SAM-dependent methyltransferase